ncbi:sugar ABC transporter permease YjfF [Streptosporangiaceae bacterium NEAU-GS5]|nr:sugar ABC transporter permease YjfF [Streptosporangiaceae bacterium NEAU-GS5]
MTAFTFVSRRGYLPVLVTLGLLVAVFVVGSILYYPDFGTGQVVVNLFIDNGFLLVTAVGMTFVILSGGIDLSVGAVVALGAMLCAWLTGMGWPAWLAIVTAIAAGALLGFIQGYVIHEFEIQPFIATLAGMFLARGLCFVISIEQIPIKDPFFDWVQTPIAVPGDMFIKPTVILVLVIVAIAYWMLHYTRFGRNVYAVGGSAQSALLMGLPLGRTRILTYVVSGVCSAIAGVLFGVYTLSGSGLHAVGMELDAIAAVVIGGTLLTGGYGYVLGTLLGVMLLGTIKTLLNFQGTLSSWWTRIAIGVLLFVFIVLQRALGTRRRSAGV